MDLDYASLGFFFIWFIFFTYESYKKYCNNNKKIFINSF